MHLLHRTRWRIAPIAGPPDQRDPKGPGFPAWSVTLARARGGNTALNPTLSKPLDITWNDETHTFNLVSPFRSGASLAPKAAYGALQRHALSRNLEKHSKNASKE